MMYEELLSHALIRGKLEKLSDCYWTCVQTGPADLDDRDLRARCDTKTVPGQLL